MVEILFMLRGYWPIAMWRKDGVGPGVWRKLANSCGDDLIQGLVEQRWGTSAKKHLIQRVWNMGMPPSRTKSFHRDLTLVFAELIQV